MTDTNGYHSHFFSARDGLKLHARDYGPLAGGMTPVLCLSGLARTSADFHTLALALAHDAKRPRRILALDYRGRGLSERDPDWRNYDIKVELDDVLTAMAALGMPEAIFVGTSRGGLITMAMAPVRPNAIRGVVLNDIGPVIDAQGLIRIRGYVGKMPAPRDWSEAVEIMRYLFGAQFPALNEAEWLGYAQRTWRDENGHLSPWYDPKLMKPLELLDLEAPTPVLWPFFDGLKHAPMLVLRGEHSDLLSEATLRAMEERRRDCTTYTVEGQGHAPLLESKDVISRIARLCARVDEGKSSG